MYILAISYNYKKNYFYPTDRTQLPTYFINDQWLVRAVLQMLKEERLEHILRVLRTRFLLQLE
jgi:hypothetical protein